MFVSKEKHERLNFDIDTIPGPKIVVADALGCEHFAQPSVFHRLTQFPYGTRLEKTRALNHDCDQDVFRLSCHPFGLVRDCRPGAGPSMETILAPERVVRHTSPDSDKLLTDFIEVSSMMKERTMCTCSCIY